MSSNTLQRLAVYGTLAPGRENHHLLSDLSGTWTEGNVRGHHSEDGWGLTGGHPGLRLDADGDEIRVFVLESPSLLDHWDRLDAFEGEDYDRVIAPVETPLGVVDAFIYIVAT